MCSAGPQPRTYSTLVSFSSILYIRNTYFQEDLRVFVIHFFCCNVSTKNVLSLFLCFFKKSDALYLFPTNWLLLMVIDKFTIIEFTPFSLVTNRALSLSARFACVSRAIVLSFLLFHTVLFLLKLNAQFLRYLHLSLRPATCDKLALLKFLPSFIFVISVLQLVFQKYDGIIYLTFYYSQCCTNIV